MSRKKQKRIETVEDIQSDIDEYQQQVIATIQKIAALENKNEAAVFRAKKENERELEKSKQNRLDLDYSTQLNHLFAIERAEEQAEDNISRLKYQLSEEYVKSQISDEKLIEAAKISGETRIAQIQNRNREIAAQIVAAKEQERETIAAEAESKLQEQKLANIKQLQDAEANAVAARKAYLDQDNLMTLAKAAVADMKTQTEKARLELAVQETLRHDTTLHAEALALKRTQALAKERVELNNRIDEALLAEDEDLTTERGKRIAQRIKNEAAAQKADKEVNEYISKLPLIGIKLGQRGNILDAFKDLSKVTDETTGKVWSLSKANEAWKNATTAMRGTGKFNAEGKEIQEVDKEASAKRKKKGNELANKIGAAQKKAATGDGKAQETINLVKAFQESQKTLTDALKAQESAEKSGSDEDKKKTTDAVEAAKAQVEEQAKALGKNLDMDGLQAEDINAAEAKMAKKGTGVKALANASAILANLAQKLEGTADEAALLKARADTRLFGSRMDTDIFGSYWGKIAWDIAPTMISPFLKEEDLVKNIQAAIEKGIAADAEQVGLLETLKDKIAQTFDAFDTNLRRLVRIQDINTTAARLGMEASLNEFLNSMYETTEYLSDIAASVRGSLTEAEALMEGENAVAFEYQVQKWLGSLYSEGVSQSGISAISDALGKLAAGDIQGIINGGAGNLLIMAANNANLSIADILAKGLDASETNTLLNQMVNYMKTLVSESNNNLVVQQELAKVFGLTASDLKAAAKIIDKEEANTISAQESKNTYQSMLNNLFNMADTMWTRTSIGEMMSNMWANVNYATASAMGTNPVFYVLNKVADIMNTFAGGIPIPMISVMGNTVDTKLKIADILNMTSVLGGFTQALIGMFAGLGNGGSGFGSGLLKMVGISGQATGKKTTSSSGTVSTYSGGSGDDIQEGAKQEGKDKNKEEDTSAAQENSEVTTKTLDEDIQAINSTIKAFNDAFNSYVEKIDRVISGDHIRVDQVPSFLGQ